MAQYVKRIIHVTISLGTGQFGADKGSEVTLSGLRVSANMASYNGDAQGQLQLRVFGMPLDLINHLTTIGPVMTQRRNNRITVTAGEENGVMATVYEGTIDAAFGEFQSAPEVVFNVIALAAAFQAVEPTVSSAYPGSVDASVIMSNLAKTMGFVFENNGVSVMLTDRTYSGSALTQVKECARDANINYTIERGKLAIWPKSSNRSGLPVEISPATGMVGYPSFSGNGIVLTTLFNPDLILGGQVKVTSDLTVANGIWNIFSINHAIESETPSGQWFSQIACYPAGTIQ